MQRDFLLFRNLLIDPTIVRQFKVYFEEFDFYKLETELSEFLTVLQRITGQIFCVLQNRISSRFGTKEKGGGIRLNLILKLRTRSYRNFSLFHSLVILRWSYISRSLLTTFAGKEYQGYKPCLYRSTIPGNKSAQPSINFVGPNSRAINSSTAVSARKKREPRIHVEKLV